MRGEKKKKIVVKKKHQIKYNSDSSDNEETTFNPQNKPLSAKEMHELDIEGKRSGGRDNSSDEDNDFADELALVTAGDENDYNTAGDKNNKKKIDEEEDEGKVETQKTTKLGSVISKILASKSDDKVRISTYLIFLIIYFLFGISALSCRLNER